MEINLEAENLFKQVLKEEIQKRTKEINLPNFSSVVTTDTIPLTIFITTGKSSAH